MSTPSQTEQPLLLSPECGMAREHEPLHRLCSDGRDIPLPGALPSSPLLAAAWCQCGCHECPPEQAEPE